MKQQYMIQNKKKIPATHFFIYKNKQYPFNFDLFKISSDYFTTNKNKIIEDKYIKLLDETEEEKIDIEEDIIINFIRYIERQIIPLNNENAVILHYLAHKYELPELLEHTEEYISTHYSEVALEQLIIHDYIDKSTYENIISSHFLDYIDNERIFSLKFPIIYRIFEKYQTIEQNSIPTEKVNKFLFKCLDKYGREASLLFKNVDIGTFGHENVQRLFNEYSGIFDFHFINSFFMKTLYDTQNELFCLQKKQEKELMVLINETKSTFLEKEVESKKKEEEMLNEIKMMREEINSMKTKILNLETENRTTKELAEETRKNQESFMKEYSELRKTVNLLFSLTLDNDLFREKLNMLDGETQNTVIKIINSINNSHQFDKVSNILTYFSKEIQDSSSFDKKIKYIYIPNCYNINEKTSECSVIGISSDMMEFLFKNDKMNTEKFKNLLSIFSEIHIEIRYPSDIFDSLYGSIVDLLYKSFKNKIKISIFITGIEKTDQKFHNNKLIDSVKLDSCIKDISSDDDNGSFEGCSSLTEILVPYSVTSIGNYAFSGCSSLTRIIIPSSLTLIGESIFAECKKLTKILIAPCSEKRIDYLEDKFLIFKTTSAHEIFYALIWTKPTVKKVIIPSFINRIEASGLRGCSSLTQITIPSSVTSIGDRGFSGCSSLTQITIPSSVTSIGSSVFSGCSLLTQITILSSVTSFEDCVFSGCSSLKQITIPSSVTSIGDFAFRGCSSLTQLSIPSSIISIGESSFSGCLSLNQISFETPSSITSIGNSAFSGCSSLSQIIIPSSVTSIGSSVFSGCSALTKISIPFSIDKGFLSIPSTVNITTEDDPLISF